MRPGDTVGVMDWDTHRFLEAVFAIPMMGAILQTVNVRLSHEQIIYTMALSEQRQVVCVGHSKRRPKRRLGREGAPLGQRAVRLCL